MSIHPKAELRKYLNLMESVHTEPDIIEYLEEDWRERTAKIQSGIRYAWQNHSEDLAKIVASLAVMGLAATVIGGMILISTDDIDQRSVGNIPERFKSYATSVVDKDRDSYMAQSNLSDILDTQGGDISKYINNGLYTNTLTKLAEEDYTADSLRDIFNIPKEKSHATSGAVIGAMAGGKNNRIGGAIVGGMIGSNMKTNTTGTALVNRALAPENAAVMGKIRSTAQRLLAVRNNEIDSVASKLTVDFAADGPRFVPINGLWYRVYVDIHAANGALLVMRDNGQDRHYIRFPAATTYGNSMLNFYEKEYIDRVPEGSPEIHKVSKWIEWKN